MAVVAVTAPEQLPVPLSSRPEMPMLSPALMCAVEGEVDTTIVADPFVNWQELPPAPPISSREAVSRMPSRGVRRGERYIGSKR